MSLEPAELSRFVQPGKEGAILRVHMYPGARRQGALGAHGDALKVAVKAPAIAGRANDALIALLADELAVPARSLSLVSGLASRDKRVRFSGLPANDLVFRLLHWLDKAGPHGQ